MFYVTDAIYRFRHKTEKNTMYSGLMSTAELAVRRQKARCLEKVKEEMLAISYHAALSSIIY